MAGTTAGWGGAATIPLLAALALFATLLLLAASHLKPHFQAHLGGPTALAGSGTRRVLLPFRGSRGERSSTLSSSLSAQGSCMAAVGDGGWRRVTDAE